MLTSKLSATFTFLVKPFRFWLPLSGSGPRDFPFTSEAIAQFHHTDSTPDTTVIDDTTWKDMLTDEYLCSISSESSIFARQMLYRNLRAGLNDADSRALGERVQALMEQPEKLTIFRHTCRSLREAEMEIATLLFEAKPPVQPVWVKYLWLLPFTLLCSIILAWKFPLALTMSALLVILLILIQIHYSGLLAVWSAELKTIQLLLRTISLLGAQEHPLLLSFAGKRASAGKLNRHLTRSLLLNLIPGAREYADWFMAKNVEHYFKANAIVFEQRNFLRQCYLEIANFEADLTLAYHLQQTSVWCRVTRHQQTDLQLQQAVHPLLKAASPLDLKLKNQGAFISGQNGSGKSTLLRCIGLNLLVARAFGFCYAQTASLPAWPLFSSMQNEDSLLTGQSLYMAELRRAQELLTAAQHQHGVFLIDEIFRGTNHLESVSGACAVLEALAIKGLVMVSSHNLILGALLKHTLIPLCISTTKGKERKLLPGTLQETNGISLLASQGFDPAVTSRAEQVSSWLSNCLEPADCANALRLNS